MLPSLQDCQPGQGHERHLPGRLPSRLFRQPGRAPHPCLRHLAPHFHRWNRSFGYFKHEIRVEWWSSVSQFGHNDSFADMAPSIATVDGASIEIAQEIGEDNVCRSGSACVSLSDNLVNRPFSSVISRRRSKICDTLIAMASSRFPSLSRMPSMPSDRVSLVTLVLSSR